MLFLIFFLLFFFLFPTEAEIVKMLSPDISSPHMVKWATVKSPRYHRYHIWESVFVLLVDACWNFFHNVLNLSPNRCHLYFWLNAFLHSYILTHLICLQASTEMHFSLAGLMLLFFFFFLFHCICNVVCVFVFYYYYYFFDTLLKMAKYLEGASRFISFCSFKRMPLTAILEPI